MTAVVPEASDLSKIAGQVYGVPSWAAGMSLFRIGLNNLLGRYGRDIAGLTGPSTWMQCPGIEATVFHNRGL